MNLTRDMLTCWWDGQGDLRFGPFSHLMFFDTRLDCDQSRVDNIRDLKQKFIFKGPQIFFILSSDDLTRDMAYMLVRRSRWPSIRSILSSHDLRSILASIAIRAGLAICTTLSKKSFRGPKLIFKLIISKIFKLWNRTWNYGIRHINMKLIKL